LATSWPRAVRAASISTQPSVSWAASHPRSVIDRLVADLQNAQYKATIEESMVILRLSAIDLKPSPNVMSLTATQLMPLLS